MKKKLLSLLLAAAMLLSLLPMSALAVGEAASVTLDVANGPIVITDVGYTQNAGALVAHTGAYVLTGSFKWTGPSSQIDYVQVKGGTEIAPIRITLNNVTIDNSGANNYGNGVAITIGQTGSPSERGHVALNLEGKNVLKGAGYTAGIELVGTKDKLSSLTIDGDGSLEAVGGESAAGIGGGMQSIGKLYYHLTINGGSINATGGENGAGIGGGLNTSGGEVIINGGTITAQGGENGAGIGGGAQASQTGYYELLTDMSITINGGDINAIGGKFGAGIGTGLIDMEYGQTQDNLPKTTLSINIGSTASVTARSTTAAGIGQGRASTTGYPKGSTIISPWVVDEINISATGRVTASGNNGAAAIGAAIGTAVDQINISNSEMGATAGAYGAAIGSGFTYTNKDGSTAISKVGDINISGGFIAAKGGEHGAGVGSGCYSEAGNINISGGIIVSSSQVVTDDKGTSGYGAGIGTGWNGTAKSISIGSAATVTAKAGLLASGIGRGLCTTPIAPFPIRIEKDANVTAYAVGDVYAPELKDNPGDPLPDAKFITALDQDCLALGTSAVAVNILMGDFKNIPDEKAEKTVLVSSTTETPITVRLPQGYASFAVSAPATATQVSVDGTVYAGDLVKRNENALTISLDNTQSSVNSYWMLQPAAVATTTVTFKVVNGTWSDGTTADKANPVMPVNGKGTLSASDVPTGMKPNSGYEGGAWDVTPNTAADGITGSVTYTYSFTEKNTGVDTTTYYTLKYASNGGNKFDDEFHAENTTVQLTKTPAWGGHEFLGWYSDLNLTDRITSIKMTDNKTVYAKWRPETDTIPGILNGDDHYAYIQGYDDGLVHPAANISRAEAATIFFRLLKDDVRKVNLMKSNDFHDVNAGDWYNTAISTMAKLGIVEGRGDGNFDPTAPITRAEFAAITARFDSKPYTGADKFPDIADSWAREKINRAAERGWVQGDGNGNFRPDTFITRAEAVTLVNRVLVRNPESTSDLLAGMKTWPDNMDTAAWFYLAIQEAGNSHDFDRKTGGAEKWTKLTANPDWSALER